MLTSPALKAAFSSWGGGLSAVLQTRIACQRSVHQGVVMQNIEQGMEATRKAGRNARRLAGRFCPVVVGGSVDKLA